MSPNRTPQNSPKSFRFKLAVSGPAIALMALVGGFAGAWSASTASPAAVGRAAHGGVLSGPGRSIALDAFATSPKSAKASVSVGGGESGGGNAKRKTGPKQVARAMLRHFRWSARQFKYLKWLWNRESGWNVHASNPYSGAYGIPQAVPGSKMASAGSHWQTSARTQIRWGLRYIRDRYGSPRTAWNHEVSAGWY